MAAPNRAQAMYDVSILLREISFKIHKDLLSLENRQILLVVTIANNFNPLHRSAPAFKEL